MIGELSDVIRIGITSWCAWQESNLLPLAPQASAPETRANLYSGMALKLRITPLVDV